MGLGGVAVEGARRLACLFDSDYDLARKRSFNHFTHHLGPGFPLQGSEFIEFGNEVLGQANRHSLASPGRGAARASVLVFLY
jgi:hypothetical protein